MGGGASTAMLITMLSISLSSLYFSVILSGASPLRSGGLAESKDPYFSSNIPPFFLDLIFRLLEPILISQRNDDGVISR